MLQRGLGVRLPWRRERLSRCRGATSPLGVQGVITELELITRQRLIFLQTEHKHGGGERHEAEELLGRVRP
jgi:hypothetical protein